MNGPEATTFASHLREHAPRYFRDLSRAPLNVQLVGEWARPASLFYRFSVGNGSQHRSVLVKVPLLRGRTGDQDGDEGQNSGERPSLVPKTDPASKFELEHTALTAIQDYFDAINDPRFGTIRILDVLPDHHAIVMEEVRDPSLRRLFLKACRLRLPVTSIGLDAPFRNAGAWLRAYHALPKQDQVTARHTQRADFVELVIKFTGFLGNALGDEPFFQGIASTTVANALEVLPESLPLGLRHGDYAMRNILAGFNNRVTVLDTLARWRSPIYEDIAYFLIELKTNRLQVLSQGLAFSSERLGRYEREFLVGYFGRQPIPYSAIRLYEVLVLLNKWSSRVQYTDHQVVGKYGGTMGTLRLALMDRFFRKSINLLL
jgi:hypothetical protein